MNRAESIEAISRALTTLAIQTRGENLAGLFSKNRLAEDIVLPVFRRVFGAPNLRNANAGTNTFPDIDLVDDTTKLAVQVTTERTSAKVTRTLRGFLSRNGHRRYQRVIVFVLTDADIRPTAKRLAEWKTICGKRLKFDAGRDLLTVPRLLALISALPQAGLDDVRETLDRSVVGTRFIDVAAALRAQARQQLNTEIAATKYIPNVFVETRQTKYLGRCFAHPRLFVPRCAEEAARLNVAGFSGRLEEAGLHPLAALPELSLQPPESVAKAVSVADRLRQQLNEARASLEPYERMRPKPAFLHPERRYIFDERYPYLEMSAYALRYRLEDRVDELNAATAQFFVLVGKAGQGKTNFVCDFIERFLTKHDIPCGFIPGRRLRGLGGFDLREQLRALLLEEAPTFTEMAKLVSAEGRRRGTPAVIVLDGLNEQLHSDFASQLEGLLMDLVRYPDIRVLLTCRSEFFEIRFGSLFRKTLANHTTIVEESAHLEREQRREHLQQAYFDYFGLDPQRFSPRVTEALGTDMLLLRFFCEAYGSRGKELGYQQPYVWDIYRDQIFRIYLTKKLAAGAALMQANQGSSLVLDSLSPLQDVLRHVARHMIDTWTFSDVPRSAVPSSLDSALMALLDEDVVLRTDLGAAELFSPRSITLNFTFDELRDYVLAQYLIHEVYATTPARLTVLLGQPPTTTTSLEGLRRFLFYASFRPECTEFSQFFRAHAWFNDVYDEEIFNVEGSLVSDADVDRVLDALRLGGEKGKHFARMLPINWREGAHPRLNLALLLQFAQTAGDDEYDRTLDAAFREGAYGGERWVTQVTRAAKRLSVGFEPGRRADVDGFFKLVALLLPVGGGANLETECVGVLRVLGQRWPAFVRDVLLWSLSCETSRLRAHAWRVLSFLPVEITQSLRSLAEQETGTAGTVLRRELDHFMSRHLTLEAP